MSRDVAPNVLVLDAMGVIYKVGDDVADLLVPFVREKGGIQHCEEIEAAYRDASLGKTNAGEFWDRVRVSANCEDEYLTRFVISDGLHEFLQAAATRFQRVVCLSNDVSEWSRKLRRLFQLESHIDRWFISGDLGVRKPDPRIYFQLVKELAVDPGQIAFVDDRVKNLDPAAELGIQTVYYDVARAEAGGGHRTIDHLTALLEDKW